NSCGRGEGFGRRAPRDSGSLRGSVHGRRGLCTAPQNRAMEVTVVGRTRIKLGLALGALGATLPLTALAQTADKTASQAAGVAADTVWVIVAALLVMFMQAGFAMLEVGFSRMKNVGTVVA